MRKIMIVVFVLLSCLIYSSCFAQAPVNETITLTTYYPSPHGVYKELRSKQMAIGQTYYNSSVVPIGANDSLIVEGNVGIGTNTPGVELDVVGDVQLSGDLKANSNARDGCHWVNLPHMSGVNYSTLCPAGEFMAGVETRENSTNTSGILQLYCCNL